MRKRSFFELNNIEQKIKHEKTLKHDRAETVKFGLAYFLGSAIVTI
jgi:hypothetical protein